MTKGWRLESARHSLARKGIETGRKTKPKSALFGSRTPDLEQIIRAIVTSDEYYAHPTKNQDKWEKFVEEEVKYDLEKGNITNLDEYIKTKAENLSVQFDEEDPIGTVIISNPDGTEQKIQLGEYQDLDLTAGDVVEDGSDFTSKWHKTDDWRGYYEVEAKGWEQLHSDTALSMSEDERELKKFDDELKKRLAEVGIPLATVITRTSNLFSSSVDYYVPTGKKAEVEKIAEQLKKKYRDEERFTSTALTGADPKEQTPQDKQFVKAVKRIHETGEAPEKVAKVILNETKREEFKMTIADMRKINKEKGQHYFDPDTMRFFKSRVESELHNDKYFITSEQAPEAKRKYSIRKFDKSTGAVDTVGEFQEYGSKASALEALKKLK